MKNVLLKRVMSTAFAVALMGFLVPAQAAPFAAFSTGVDASSSQLAPGSIDPHWDVIGAGTAPAEVRNDQTFFSNYAPNPNSRWIWTDAVGNDSGTFTFRTTFDLTGFDPASAVITGQWGVDNNAQFSLNGVTAGIGAGTFLGGSVLSNFRSLNNFTINNGFISGVNTLDVIAFNGSSAGGLNVGIISAEAEVAGVPLPGSALLLLAGLILPVARKKTL